MRIVSIDMVRATAIVFVVGLGMFVKLAWSYAIAPELDRIVKGA